jgi:hypothetical protein
MQFKTKGRKRIWTDEQLIEAVKTSVSVRQCVLKCGLKETGINSQNIKLHIKRLNLDTSHFLGKGAGKGATHNYTKRCTVEEMMVENGKRKDASVIKKYLIDKKIWEYRCIECKLSDWQNKPISLHIDHINGNPADNRIENLRLLCPNCHSQTSTYCSKNKTARIIQYCQQCNKQKQGNDYDICEDCRLGNLKNGKYVVKFKTAKHFDEKTDQEIINLLLSAGSFSNYANSINTSRTAIRRYLKNRGLLEIIKNVLSKKK